MKVLIVNAGSSSLKYQLVDMDNEQMIVKGQVERIAIEGSHLNQKTPDMSKVIDLYEPIPDHVVATKLMLRALLDPEKGVLKSVDEIGAVGHRVLHGGEEFTASCIITDEVKAAIRKFIPLGPLHNPANLMGIEACEEVMPHTPQVAVFDTAFHQTMPPKAFMYGVPYRYYKEMGVRRYGFHGTSHRYVSKRVCEFLGVSPIGIICHLGNGSSMSAVVDGKCVDTSMGLTPLEGVVMGTRSGSCDPAVVQFIANNDHMTVNEVLTMMNKQSGLMGISGLSSDMRDIDKAADEGNDRAALARDMLHYRFLRGGDGRRGHYRVHGGHRRKRPGTARIRHEGHGVDGREVGCGEEQGARQGSRHLHRRLQGDHLRHPHERGNHDCARHQGTGRGREEVSFSQPRAFFAGARNFFRGKDAFFREKVLTKPAKKPII